MEPPRAGWLGAAIVIVGAALFGTLGVASRFAYDAGVQPFAFVAWRAGAGALGILAVLLIVIGPRSIWGSIARAGRTAQATPTAVPPMPGSRDAPARRSCSPTRA